MWFSPFVPPNLLSNLPQGKEEGGGEQTAYGLESLGGDTDLQSTIPKPQQAPLYHFSVLLRKGLRKFCSLWTSDVWYWHAFCSASNSNTFLIFISK